MLKPVRLILTVAFLFYICSLRAQNTYTTEIGIHGGGSYFQGDMTRLALKELKSDVGLSFRYLFNQRISLQADYHSTRLEGVYTHRLNQLFPGSVSLNRGLNMFDLGFTFNFLDYEKLDHILKSSDYSFYLFAGLGVVSNESIIDFRSYHLSLPLGIGFKLKLAKRLHLNFQLTHRLLTNYDGLEGVAAMNNPTGNNGSNPFNNDQLTTATVGLSFNIFRRACDCMNDY